MTFTQDARSDQPQIFTLRNFGLFLAALLIVWYWPVILGNQTFVYRDFGYFGYPLAVHHRDAFWNGALPFWNSLNHNGLPFLAQWNTMTLYPGSLIYVLLPVQASLAWFDLAHLWLAGIGMFILAHRWYANGFAAAFAGLGFAISGLSINFLLWPNNVAALAWMPFVILYGLEGKPMFLRAVIVGSLQMLTGAPEVILLTWGILAALTAVKAFEERSAAPVKSFLLIAITVACLCAIQLLPFLDLARISQRHRDFGSGFWSMPLWGWASFFVPLVYTYTLSSGVRFQYDQLWTSSYYPSIAVTLLAIIGVIAFRKRSRREKTLAILALVALLLALGPAGHFYSFFKAVVPGLGLIRFPIKFVIVALFALPLLAAATLANDDPNSKVRRNVWRGLALVTIAILLYARYNPKFAPPFDNWALTARSAVLAFLFASLAIIGFAGLHNRKFQIALLLVIPLDVFLHAPNPAPTIARAAMAVTTSTNQGRAMLSRQAFETLYNEAIPDTTQNFLSNRLALNANLNLIDRTAKVDGFFSLNSKWSERLRNQLYAKGQGNLDAIMDFMGVTRISSASNIFEWTTRETAMPLITAGQSPRFLDDTNCLYALFDLRFIPREKVVFSERFDGYETNRVAAEVRSANISTKSISFEIDSPKPTFALIAQSFHPNWRATLNGQPARILRANYAFQAIAVSAGKSQVELKYVDRAFQLGALISLVTLGALFIVGLRQ